MSSIFVSYRRTDAPGHAGRIYDRLVERFGAENVFRDLDSIEPGADFPKMIEDTVARCAALLAVLGPNWLTADKEGVQRLSSPHDWVRLEIASALQRDIRVVPILVQGASMPDVADLPGDLKPLARRNAVELTETAWGLQLSRLIESLGETARASWSATLVERTWLRDVFRISLSHDVHLLEYRCGSIADTIFLNGTTLKKVTHGADVSLLRFELTDGAESVDVDCRIKQPGVRAFPAVWTIRVADRTLFDGKAKR
jgi:TIR domain-containing protein